MKLLAALLAVLTGEVRDPSKGVVPEVTVVATEVRTNQSQISSTGSAGVFSFPNVKPGLYQIAVEAPGFKRFVREGVQVATGERVRVDVELEVGDERESVTVRSEAPLLQTESGGLGQLIAGSKIASLPLDGRSFLSLVALSPGVALPAGSSFPRINGGRPRTNEFLFDGISVLQPEPGQVAFSPVLDAIQEFRVEVNSPGAEFGRFNGGIINLTTRSGGNELHGSVFGFFRHEALNARNLFSPRKPAFRRSQFGSVVGGPIRKDRSFFFADYQGTRQQIERVRISTVPTLLERQGVFGGNRIPLSRMDPVALDLLSRYPAPTSSGAANNFLRIGREEQNQDQWDLRLDHRFSQADHVFGRFSYSRDRTIPAAPLPDGSGQIALGTLGLSRTLGLSFASSYLHIFGPSATNELRLGYTRRSLDRRPLNGLATFRIDGFQQLGPPPNTRSDFRTDVTEVADTISIQRGRHSIKAGLDFRWPRLDIVQPPSPLGLYRFSALFTGSSLASFLLGQVQEFSIDVQEKALRPRASIHEYFVQDDWKATRRLAINAGLRYTLNFPSTELDNQGAVFNLWTETLDYLGRDGFPRSARRLETLNFGPRLGVAYRVQDRTVVRSGYGLIWIEQSGVTTPFTNPQFPFLQSVTERSLDNVQPAFVLAAGPRIAPIPPAPEAGLGQGVFSVDRSLGSGYAQQWNFSIQRQLKQDLVFEIAYAGSKITRLGVPDTNINQLRAEQLGLGPALVERVPNPFFGHIPRSSLLGDPTIPRAQLLRPYPRFTTVSLFRNNVGNSSYHALEAKVEKRLSRGSSFLVGYTRSKLIDDASSVFDAAILAGPVANFPAADSFNRRLERDVSSGDMPNAFVASFTWELPRGWEVAGIVTLQSGLPLAVTQATNFNAFAGFGTQRPNRRATPELPASRRSTARFFDTEAFQAAGPFAIGNSSRNPLRGPGRRNVDLAVIRRLPFGDGRNVEFRAEGFNLTNTPPLDGPNTVLGTPGFGSITSAGDPRVIQLAVKVNF